MPVSDKLALEIFTIELFHLPAVLAALSCGILFWLRARRSPLLVSFLGLIGTLLLWMISKIFKTVSPNETLRWIFIVTQYFGIQFSGFFLVVFAHLYTRQKALSKKALLLLSMPPFLSFCVVLSNPLHMQFYSYFDFYRDSFGPLFFPVQGVLYTYLLAGILMLSLGFTRQPQFAKRKTMARLFAAAIMVPIAFNVYYLLVKLTDIPFVLGFPFFDFTPITSTIALILFIIPAFRYRFLDILPFAYRSVFDQLPDGMAVLYKDGRVRLCNRSFIKIASDPGNLSMILKAAASGRQQESARLTLDGGREYLVTLHPFGNHYHVLVLKDRTVLVTMETELLATNGDLLEMRLRLEKMLDTAHRLAETKMKTRIAQDVHDIFGHTLIVVLGLLDIASGENHENSLKKLSQAKELLHSGVLDLRLSLAGEDRQQKTTLERSISGLANDAISLDFSVQGKVREVKTEVTDALFRICQEAMTNAIRHGRAEKISIILRFHSEQVELFIIDDGIGCAHVERGYGLKGMEQRAFGLNGSFSFGSDGERGFHLHAVLPLSETA